MKTFFAVIERHEVLYEFDRRYTIGLFENEDNALTFAKKCADELKPRPYEKWTPVAYFEDKDFGVKGYRTTYDDQIKDFYVTKTEYYSDCDVQQT